MLNESLSITVHRACDDEEMKKLAEALPYKVHKYPTFYTVDVGSVRFFSNRAYGA
jgi:hypothetical protein